MYYFVCINSVYAHNILMVRKAHYLLYLMKRVCVIYADEVRELVYARLCLQVYIMINVQHSYNILHSGKVVFTFLHVYKKMYF